MVGATTETVPWTMAKKVRRSVTYKKYIPDTRSPINDTWNVRSSWIVSHSSISSKDPFGAKSVRMHIFGGSIQAPTNCTK